MANARTAEADIMANALTSLATNGDPSTYAEAVDTPQKMQWEAAIREDRSGQNGSLKPKPIRTGPYGTKHGW